MLHDNFPERKLHYSKKMADGYCMMLYKLLGCVMSNEILMVKGESAIMWEAAVMVYFNTRIPAFT
jgi:hypothetical protein